MTLSSDSADKEPDSWTITINAVTNNSLGLFFSDDGTILEGTIRIYCYSVTSATYSAVAKSMVQINQTQNGLIINLERLVIIVLH